MERLLAQRCGRGCTLLLYIIYNQTSTADKYFTLLHSHHEYAWKLQRIHFIIVQILHNGTRNKVMNKCMCDCTKSKWNKSECFILLVSIFIWASIGIYYSCPSFDSCQLCVLVPDNIVYLNINSGALTSGTRLFCCPVCSLCGGAISWR